MSKIAQIAEFVKANKTAAYKDVAEHLGVKVAAVTGSLPSLVKQDSNFSYANGVITYTPPKKAAKEKVAKESRSTKTTAAYAVIARFYASGSEFRRKDLVAAVSAEAGLSAAGASTYIQNWKKANGKM